MNQDENDESDRKDYRALFSVYALKVANQTNHLIPVNYLWESAKLLDKSPNTGQMQIVSTSMVRKLFSEDLQIMMIDDNRSRLLKHLAQCDSMGYGLDKKFPKGDQFTVEKAVEILESEPYCASSQTILTTTLVKEVLSRYCDDGTFVNVHNVSGGLNAAVTRYVQTLQKRNDLLANLYKQLRERGLNYEMLFENIWGFLDIKTKKINRNEVEDIFKSVKLRFTSDQLDAFMETMSYENDDLVLVSDFLKEGERHTIGQRKEKK